MNEITNKKELNASLLDAASLPISWARQASEKCMFMHIPLHGETGNKTKTNKLFCFFHRYIITEIQIETVVFIKYID